MTRFAKLAAISAVAFVALAAPSTAQERRDVPAFRTLGEPASAADAKAVAGVLDAFREAWGAQDVDAIMALHAEDLEWINAYARMFQNAADLERFLADRMFPNFDPAVSRQEVENMKLVSIRYVGDDAAVIHAYTDGNRGPSRNAGETVRRTHMHFVLESRPEGWRIVHEVIMDAR